MTISSSLNAGVMGLSANATRLSTISDNIANSATYGYKRSEVDFASLVIRQRASAYSAGGVRVNTFKDIGATGSIVTTGSATDLAVGGRGLFPVTDATGLDTLADQRELQLMPTGSFFPDADGYLRNPAGLYLLGWRADATGAVTNVSRNSGADLEPINISTNQLVASPTTVLELGINLPASATDAGLDPDPYQLPIEYFDNIGRSQTITFEFTPVIPTTGSSGQWQVQIYDTAGDPSVSIGTLDLEFSDGSVSDPAGRLDSVLASNGVTYDPLTGQVSIDLPHGNVQALLGMPNGNNGISQFSSPFTQNIISKDGGPVGELQSIEIDPSGFLHAVYGSGYREALYQIPIGDVPNMNGLQANNGQSVSLTAESGDLYFWDAGTGPVGTLIGNALMESTTDIASELTDLIETQRAYSSNAKIVQTVDEMLQETTNIKR